MLTKARQRWDAPAVYGHTNTSSNSPLHQYFWRQIPGHTSTAGYNNCRAQLYFPCTTCRHAQGKAKQHCGERKQQEVFLNCSSHPLMGTASAEPVGFQAQGPAHIWSWKPEQRAHYNPSPMLPASTEALRNFQLSGGRYTRYKQKAEVTETGLSAS